MMMEQPFEKQWNVMEPENSGVFNPEASLGTQVIKPKPDHNSEGKRDKGKGRAPLSPRRRSPRRRSPVMSPKQRFLEKQGIREAATRETRRFSEIVQKLRKAKDQKEDSDEKDVRKDGNDRLRTERRSSC